MIKFTIVPIKTKILLATALFTSVTSFIIYQFLIKKWKSKNKKIKIDTSKHDYTLRSPFAINTSNRHYIDYTKDLESKWKGPFTFVQCADTQFGLIDRYVYNLPTITWDKEINYLRLTIQSVNSLRPRPRFLVICGDLVDAFPNQVNLRKEQVSDLKVVLQELDKEIKIVCVCGNHDIGDVPTEDSIQIYTNDFGDDYFSFWVNGCKFLALNSQFFFNSSKVPHLKKKHEDWLERELSAKENWKHLMLFQHIPWFLHRPHEAAHDYFNIEPIQRLKWLEKFKRAGVSKIFCGHYHQNAGGFYDNLEVIVTTAVGAQLGPFKHGYRLVEVDENNIQHTFIPISDEVN